MAFKNRVRLPFYLSKPQFPVTRNVFRNAAGETTLLSAVIRNTYEGKTDQMPEDWHRKLVVALSHGDVNIQDQRFLSDVVLDGEYGIEWQDFLNYPVASSNFTIQVTPFNASSNNCQSCAEITQLNLNDDYTDAVWSQDSTNDYPDIITANDEICCYPYEIEVVTFNTDYFTSVTISQSGILTAVVKEETPTLNNVLIATYRVTCENGGYDEANVYGNIEGTSTVCVPPTSLNESLDANDGTIATLSWTEPSPAPDGGYNWFLYLASNIYTAVNSGNTSDDHVNLTGLTPGEDYIFVVQSLCGEDSSVPVNTEFTTPTTGLGLCGSFFVYYVPTTSTPPQSITFVKCDGTTQTYIFMFSQAQEFCMLESVPGSHVPAYAATSTPDISISYIDPC